MPHQRGPAAPTDTPPKRGRRPKPDAPRTPSGQISRGKGIRERGPSARSEHIGCRLTKADAEALEAAAVAAGRKASEWARHLILLGMGVQKLGQEVGADMDGSPESALASIKTRLKAAGKHGITFGDPVEDPEPGLALAMCDAARWLAERLGCDPGATAPMWFSEGGDWTIREWIMVGPGWRLVFNETGWCGNHEGISCQKVRGISRVADPTAALAAACMAVGGVPDALLEATRTKEPLASGGRWVRR